MTKNLVFAAAAMVAVLLAGNARAALFAYEGFDVAGATDGQALKGTGTGATGLGFTGTWTRSSGDGNGGSSTWEAAGLSYPASYPGTHVAVGGNGHALPLSDTSGHAYLNLALDAAADAAVNGASNVYISFLGEIGRGGKTTTTYYSDGNDANGQRTFFNLAAEYVRPAGVRLMNVSASNNSAMGLIGNSGDWNGGGQSVYGDSELNPEVVDTWGAFEFKSSHNLFTGNGGTSAAAGSADYNPLPAHYNGVDQIVVSVTQGLPAHFRVQVNPQVDGSNDGELEFDYHDGATPLAFLLKAFGLQANAGDVDKSPGDFVVDEIYIASTFREAAGFAQVPEPSTIALLGLGGAALLAVRRRK